MVVDFDVSKAPLLEIIADVQTLIEATDVGDFSGQTVRAVLIADGELNFLSTRK